MKKYIIYILLGLGVLTTSCEDVIDVEVPTAPARLVVEASIEWEKETTGNEQTILLSKSTPYFEANQIDFVTNATVKIVNEDTGEEFVFDHQNGGNYVTTSFVPVIDAPYLLEIQHEGETYLARENMIPVVDLDSVYQSTENGFLKDALEVNIDFTDPVGEGDYYYFTFHDRNDLFPELGSIPDEFVDGNQISIFMEKDEEDDDLERGFEPGDIVDINFYGTSEEFFEYISLLAEQGEAGGPFGNTPVEVKGNCVNPTNPENYAFGYFRVTQVVRETYVFE